MSDDIRSKVEASSLGSAAAKAARESVTDEQAARVVARAGELRRREAIAEVLADVGGEHGENPDNRAAWIDYYLHLADALLGSDVLAQIRAEARAEAWDEGYEAGSEDTTDAYWGDYTIQTNPYRAGGSA